MTASTNRLIGMLKSYKVPYMVFVNKMDMCERTEDELLDELSEKVGDGFIKYEDISAKMEEVATLSEVTIEKYLEEEKLSKEDVTGLIASGRFHPVVFGSALRNENINRTNN